MRLINADALIDKYGDWYTEEGTEEGYIGTIKGIVDSMPTIEPERKKGKWIDNETSYADGVRQTCTCSICGQRSVRPLGRFCRWCGADMGGDKDDQR